MPLTKAERAAIEKAIGDLAEESGIGGYFVSEFDSLTAAIDAATAPEPPAPSEWRKQVEAAVAKCIQAHSTWGVSALIVEEAEAEMTAILDRVDALAKREGRALCVDGKLSPGAWSALASAGVDVSEEVRSAVFVNEYDDEADIANRIVYHMDPSGGTITDVSGARTPVPSVTRLAILLTRFALGEEPEGGM